MIYRFRVILNSDDEVFRDIEIQSEASFEDFNNVILQSFGFDGSEMASFYTSNEQWEQLLEIAQFDMGEKDEPVITMGETYLENIINKDDRNLVYVYDFLLMWTFIIELADIAKEESGMTYPNVMYSHGEVPFEPKEPEFVSENLDGDPFDDEYGDDDYGMDADDYESLDFDENWN
ncbi:hypothetical protein ULMS_13380 [Patiriisocius marinistellae]|uniref:Plasmid pRiA4b Orf3-like domain-containing protein n=1 Tax=Patiriisocius marinistellae TaxID=2494560 RepID=A0A5J4FV50_9FLAO|nr:hypothetical protein [Patiriisocius marinistellae]GEQ85830.1 hypothetical protein ULMS_13380 [Patiriisocius marinistellae]